MASSSSRKILVTESATVILAILILVFTDIGSAATPYLGKKIGSFKTYHHDVVGDVYAVDSRTIHVKGFSYDGQGPDAFFWAGSSSKPNSEGFIVADEKGTKNVLQAYRSRDLTLTLPEGKTLKDIKWLAVWCRSFAANFADVAIPAGFNAPKPQRLEGIVSVMHNTSSGPIVIVDAQTFMVPNFHTDGQAPDAHFWVGRGPKPTAEGILVPDENGSAKPLGRYDGQSLVIALPGDLTVFDIDWLSVWCIEFAVDFGHVKIPKNLNVPPSLKMLGVSPQSKLNCEVLSEALGFEVRWARAGDTIVVQLVARLVDGEYMSFGLSGDSQHSQMIGGDVIVAWIDAVGNGHAIDYFLADKAQCAGGRGSCPDRRIQPNTNTVRLLNAAIINGYSMITYQRPLVAVDRWDRPLRRNGSQPIIWAVGPLNSEDEVSYHTQRNKADMFIDFGRTPSWNCPAPLSDPHSQPASSSSAPSGEHGQSSGLGSASSSTSGSRVTSPSSATSGSASTTSDSRQPLSPSTVDRTRQDANSNDPSNQGSASSSSNRPTSSSPPEVTPLPVKPAEDAWYIPPIECPEPQDNVFYAQIGPAGGKKGYTSITGHVGWGIAWYINGLLIPEVTVVRGKTYTFVVEGGNDPDTPARNHPFYITDDPIGGLGTKSLTEQEKVRVYAGVRFNADGEPEASAAGRLCEWVQRSKEVAEVYNSFGEYQRVLELSCDKGQAAVLQWTPDAETPDAVYYQCYTHRYLGWKIHVIDQCEADPVEFGSSFLHETNVSRDVQKQQLLVEQDSPSVTPSENTGRSFPDSKLVRVGGTISTSVMSTKIGVGNIDPSSGPSSQADPTRHHPIASNGNVHLLVHDDNFESKSTALVKDPFVFNESVPFQAGFRPGEPQFGGFGASDFGQRFEKAPPVYVNKQMVPKFPSRLGSVYEPPPPVAGDNRRRQTVSLKVEDGQLQPGIRQPIVFRASADQAPAGIFVRRRVAQPTNLKVTVNSAGQPGSRPQFGQQLVDPSGNPQDQAAIRRRLIVRPPGLSASASAPAPVLSSSKKLQESGPADDPILSNIWSIIDKEKEVHHHVRNTRVKRSLSDDMDMMIQKTTSASVIEPEMSPIGESEMSSEGEPVPRDQVTVHYNHENEESMGMDVSESNEMGKLSDAEENSKMMMMTTTTMTTMPSDKANESKAEAEASTGSGSMSMTFLGTSFSSAAILIGGLFLLYTVT